MDSKKLRNITMAGLFAAMITIMTAYLFHVPYGVNGGYIHFGDMLIYLAAVLLPKPYAIAAAAIAEFFKKSRRSIICVMPIVLVCF